MYREREHEEGSFLQITHTVRKEEGLKATRRTGARSPLEGFVLLPELF